MRALVVAGARPNFMKVTPLLTALDDDGHEGILVHTGQHYDTEMSDAFFDDLDLPTAAFHLEVGSDTHARQTERVMEAFEPEGWLRCPCTVWSKVRHSIARATWTRDSR